MESHDPRGHMLETFWNLEKILMSVKGLDDCEMPTRSTFEPTQNTTLGWSGPKDQQNKTDHLHLVLSSFIAFRGP